MKNFLIVINKSIEDADVAADKISAYIKAKGGSCISHKGYISDSDVPRDIECIIALGGDGTIISTASVIALRDIPIAGINLGHLGYLTAITKEDDIEPMLDAMLNDNINIEDRMMLEGHIENDKKRTESFYALNEIVISRNMDVNFRAIRFGLTVNGEQLNDYSADGVIIATPTGSTAYNLSAGGPVAQPDSKLLIVTPICPHSLGHISMVLDKDAVVEIEPDGSTGVGQVVISDGCQVATITKNERLIVKKADCKVRLVQLREGTFLDNLKNKLAGV